jgi:hypothetical protein
MNLKESLNAALSLRNQRMFVAVVVLSIAPLWIGSYLPFVDLPQHAAQIAALRELWRGNQAFTQLFEINWFTPYLLGYLLLAALSAVLPVMIAAKVIVSASIVALPLLTGRLLRVAGADERWQWLAIPGSFSFALYWGFLSFIVAAPLALVFLILTIRFADSPTPRRALGIAAFSIFLFFCHIIVLGFASLVSLGYLAGRHYRDPKTLVLRALPYTAALPLIAAWFAFTYKSETVVQNNQIIYGVVRERLEHLVLQPAGHDGFTSLLSPLITAAVFLLPLLAGCRFSSKPERWLPFVLGLLVFMVAPRYVFSTAYFYQRLGVFLVPLWLLAWESPGARQRRFAEWGAIAVVLLWTFTSISRFAAFARETESFRTVIAQVPPGQRIASMIYDHRSPYFALPVYMHFPAWYAATQRGISDFNFADFISQMVRYRKDAGPRITEDLAWYPTMLDWQRHGGDSYDYFIVKSPFDISGPIFKQRRGNVELVARSGWWWLYRNVRRGAPTEQGSALDALGDHQQRTAGRQ